MNVDSRTLDRTDLQAKVLPELQQMADTLGVEGHQRLKKGDLIDAILAKASQDGMAPSGSPNGETRTRPGPEGTTGDDASAAQTVQAGTEAPAQAEPQAEARPAGSAS